MKNKGGRPSKLTPEIREALISGLKEGLTLKVACKYAGISYSTFANWRQKSRRATQKDVLTLLTQLMTDINIEVIHIQQQHRLEVRNNRKPRDFRYGWKNPMPDAIKQKLRVKAFEQAIENYQLRRRIY